MIATTNVDVASPRFKADPYPFYAHLRAQAPVFRITLPSRQPAWLVSRYDDVLMVLKDDRFAKDRRKALTPDQMSKEPWMPPMFRVIESNMLMTDEPEHRRLRMLVHQAFTPRIVDQMRTQIQTLTDDLLDQLQLDRHVDLIGAYALPIPTTVIAQMLGVPVAARHKFSYWTNSMVSASASRFAFIKVIPHVMAFLRYIRKLVQARRAAPRDDLISFLVQAEESGDKLSEDEVVAMIFLLLVAGHETTVNLIGNGMLALLQHPDQLELLRNDPALIKSAVEELLRYASPVEWGDERFTREDVTIEGMTIPRGELVHGVIASANRDGRQFADPDKLDITREPNRHLAFGQGIHYCLGAPLARMEGQIAINSLLQRLPDIRLAVPPQDLKWRQGTMLRGLQTLPVVFGQRQTASQRSTSQATVSAG